MSSMAKAARSVSWAPGLKLCQVRLFLSEDAPVLSGLDSQDHLQAKTSRIWHSSTSGSDESLPPGFEFFNPANHFKIDFSQIPLIQWKYPSQFDLNPDWLLVAGEESAEVHAQNRRQVGVLEAIYPRPSSIPPNPSVSPEALNSYYDDNCTMHVPITPIEDEDSDAVNSLSPFDATVHQKPQGLMAVPSIYNSQQPQGSSTVVLDHSSTQGSMHLHGAEPDLAAAATLAFTAIMSSVGKDSLVDRELLIKILSDPKLVEKLVLEHGNSERGSTPDVTLPSPLGPSTTTSVLTHFNVPPTSQTGSFHPTNFVAPNVMNPPVAEATARMDLNTGINVVRSGGAKDITYYKSLIEQHGGEKHATWGNPLPRFGNYHHGDDGERAMQGIKQQRDLKLRTGKPCAFFNTPRGCKHGESCLFLHDTSLPQGEEGRNSKRIKLDREITGSD